MYLLKDDGMNIEFIGQKIAKKYIASGDDMNESIAKIACEQNLNLEQTKRLIEESNKACYLEKFATTGEQIFDIADLTKVKSHFNIDEDIEKKANTFKLEADYSKDNAYGVSIDFEKRASVTNNNELEKEAELQFNNLLEDTKLEIGSNLNKFAELRKKASYLMPALEKVAEENFVETMKLSNNTEVVKLAEEVNDCLSKLTLASSFKKTLLEKKATIIGKVISGTVGAGVNATTKVVGKGVGWVAESPMKRGLTPLFTGQQVLTGAKNAATSESHIGNLHLDKTASLVDDLKVIFSKALPGVATLGMIGVGVAAANKMGGLTARMMEQRQLDKAFGIMAESNPDIASNPQARDYFNVVARHSPSLALDPMVAPQLVRQFDSFGGVDVNTVAKLREIENRLGPQSNRSNSFETASNILSNAGNINKSFLSGKKEGKVDLGHLS